MTAREVIRWCRQLATHSEHPGGITRTCLSAPMRLVHRDLSEWMTRIGMTTAVDAAGNLRGVRAASTDNAARLFLGSHLDTVPDAGAFDGVLGVVWAIALIESLQNAPLPFEIEVLGFSDEEGVRFGTPFIGSRALIGTLDDTLLDGRDAAGISLRDALDDFGADLSALHRSRAGAKALGYLECHIEQGPVLEQLDRPLGLVKAIVGQTRAEIKFIGQARHAGTTPMSLRHDAVAGAAEWILAVERAATETRGAVATVGRVDVTPGAGNVIAKEGRVSVDVRHADDATRQQLVTTLREAAATIAARRGLTHHWDTRLDQPAVATDADMSGRLARAADTAGAPLVRMTSGAGHDAMIMATRMPVAMLFVRSAGGISHHPDEDVREEDVAVALDVGRQFIIDLAEKRLA
jgi:allantoate deiminase